jgi:PAS domain S-box-containing protein
MLQVVIQYIFIFSAGTAIYILVGNRNNLLMQLRQINRFLYYLKKSEFAYVEDIELNNAHPEIKVIFSRLTDLMEIVNQRDVKRDHAEKNLRYSELKYREMAEFLPQGIFEADELRNITYANKAWLDMMGFSNAEIKDGLKLSEIFDNNDLEIMFSENTSIERECKVLTKDGSSKSSMVFTSRKIKDNKLKGIRCITIDDTERKRQIVELEKARAKAEGSDKLKSAFLANMSHEIRTPMNAIIGFSNLLYERELDEVTKREYLQYIKSSGQHLLKLIDDIIDIAKIEAGELKITKAPFNLNALMTELQNWFVQIKQSSNKDIDIIFANAAKNADLIINSDSIRLRQVLSNLIGNGLKFTNTGFVEFGYDIFAKTIQFYVKDTGVGIPGHLHEAIFDRFQQVDYIKFKGTGLGLTITKNLIQILEGRIWLHSEEGKGSTFFFTIPFKQSQILTKKNTQPQMTTEIKFTGQKLLIAEDNDLNYYLLERMLSHSGLRVIRVKNGKEAIRVGLKIADIILMDMQLPIIDGYSATRQVKRLRPDVPIIAQTAFALAEDKHNCIDAGCDDYLSKPIDRELLFNAISRNLKVKREVVVV